MEDDGHPAGDHCRDHKERKHTDRCRNPAGIGHEQVGRLRPVDSHAIAHRQIRQGLRLGAQCNLCLPHTGTGGHTSIASMSLPPPECLV